MVSAWFSPRLVAHCWAAGPCCSSAGDSHKKAHSKERSADDRIKLDLECLNKYNEVCRQVNIFYFIPVVWETEGIHKAGTGNVETSEGYLKQCIIYMRERNLAAAIVVSPCCFAVPGQDLGSVEGHLECWGPVEAQAALAGR